MDKEIVRARRKARKMALQALYQWQLSGSDLHEIEAQFRMFHNLERVDADYFCRLLHEIPKEIHPLEAQFHPFLDRDITALNPVELTVIRIGTYELMHCLEFPYKVVLDESITLCKEFGSQDGFRYVNGILNGVARQVRVLEVQVDG